MRSDQEKVLILGAVLLIAILAAVMPFALRVPTLAKSFTAYADSPIVQQVTGGGWILYGPCGEEETKKTFGFVAMELEDGTLRGNVEYVDHGPFGGNEKGYPHVHGYEITALTIVGDTADIWGICRLNGDKTERTFHVRVIDEDEPGKYDWFGIEIPSIGYLRWEELGFPEDRGGGGNIQIHRPAP